uniref:hypothetical protein n=1 Tax=Alistipes putredinis TaxID=28117 RepID=UPI003FD7AEDA
GLKSGISGRLVRDGRLFCRSRETREGRPGRGGRRRDSYAARVFAAGSAVPATIEKPEGNISFRLLGNGFRQR